MRLWTSTSGKTLKAQFEKAQYGSVYLKKEDGSAVRISLRSLSAADRAVVKKLAASSRTDRPCHKSHKPLPGGTKAFMVYVFRDRNGYRDNHAPSELVMME